MNNVKNNSSESSGAPAVGSTQKIDYNLGAEDLIALVDEVRNAALMDMADFFLRTPEKVLSCHEAALLCADAVNASIQRIQTAQTKRSFKMH